MLHAHLKQVVYIAQKRVDYGMLRPLALQQCLKKYIIHRLFIAVNK